MPTQRPRVLLLDNDPKQRRALARTLRAINADVTLPEDLEPPSEPGLHLVIANQGAFDAAGLRTLMARCAQVGAPLLLVSESRSQAHFLEVFQHSALTNLIARNDAVVDSVELIITARKILEKDIFGMEKYFGWGVVPETLRVRSSRQKHDVLQEAERFAESLDINPRFVAQFAAVAEELFTNAIYNAPRDRDGMHRFAHVSRTEDVELADGEHVEIQFCFDGRRLGIATADPFGSLSPALLNAYLLKCLQQGPEQVDHKPGGAGLGLYYLFDSVSSLIVNVAPGERTEFIGIMDVSGSFRDFSLRHKSFHVFTR